MSKKLFMVFISSLILFGCVPTAFVAGTVTGSVVYDHRSTKTIIQDREITFKIQNKLNNDEQLRNQSHLSITTFNHVALLLGQALTPELRDRAVMIAKSDPRIKLLYNEIAIKKPTSNLARANDTWITTKVKTVLAATPSLNSSSLKIITEDKVVYLMGLTSRTQAKLAADKTRTVSGVKKVVKLFEYLN